MDNVVLTSASQISPSTGNPINPSYGPPLASEPETTSTIEALVSSPLEPVEKSDVDGNFQGHMDVNYQPHDVALAAAKANGHPPSNVVTLGESHKMEIDDGYEHPDKITSCCSTLNKLFLALAIVCFALFLCSIAFIIANLDGLNGKHDARRLSQTPYPYPIGDPFFPSDKILTEPYFNLTQPNKGGIIVVLSRRGASINNILIPSIDKNRVTHYRSIVLQGNNNNNYGSVRFGFDGVSNSDNMTNGLPPTYPFLNFYNDNWTMYGDVNKPYRIRFVNGLVEVIYEFSATNNNELLMTTIVSAPLYDQVTVDPTNNIYFNLRGYGNLSTHHLNLSSSTPINIKTNQRAEHDQLIQSKPVEQLNDVNNYFYKLDRAGIGKNYIATLTESETKMTMNIFADHAGVIIDPFAVSITTPNMRGIRISPKQSPVYQTMSIYGPTLVVYPSRAIHTTWWQFEY